MKIESVLLVVLLFLFPIALIAPVHATGPTLVTSCTLQDPAFQGFVFHTNLSCGLASSGAPSWVVVAIETEGTSCIPFGTPTVSDSLGSAFGLFGGLCDNVPGTSNSNGAWIYAATVPANSGDSVNVNWRTTSNYFTVFAAVSEWSGVALEATSATGNGAMCDISICPITIGTSTSVSFISDTALIAASNCNDGLTTGFGNVGCTVPAGWTLGWHDCRGVSICTQNLEVVYSTDSTVSSPTNFPRIATCNGIFTNCGSFDYEIVGIALGTQHIVTPCTWFQLQCWWYPTLFFGLYLGVFSIVARKGEVSGEGSIYMNLTALNVAAMAQTAMALLTPVVPLLLIIITVVYAVRVRNR